MTRIHIHIAAFVLLLWCMTAVCAEQNQSGYGGAKWGMSVQQVLAAVPAVKTEKVDELGGGRVLAVKDRIDVVGAQYAANFIFDRDDKLKAVVLKPVAELDAASGLNEFEKIDIALIGKYGQPYYTNDEKARIARWHAGANDIELYLMVIPDLASIINITYRPAAAVTAGDSL